MDATVIPFRPRSDAPVQPLHPTREHIDAALFGEGLTSELEAPRAHFGLRPPVDYFKQRDAAGVVNEYVKRAAKAAADVFSGSAPSPKPVCASLLYEAAGRANALAVGARDVARLLESLGCLKQARTFYDVADYAELAAAEIEAPLHPEGA